MSDTPEEQPQPEPQIDQGHPRMIPWATGGVHISTEERTRKSDGARIIRVYFDTGDVRVVSDWTPDELAALGQAFYKQATGGLTIADGADLAALKDATPFEKAVDEARRRGKL